MDINWFTLSVVGAILLALIIFLMLRNIRDEKEFEKEMGDAELRKDDNDSTHLNSNS